MNWAEHLFYYYSNLEPSTALPKDMQWLYPQKNAEVMKIVQHFLKKYYRDNHSRKILLGINPGRFGAGVTGVNFTAPKQLTENCQIEHPFKKQSELSAEFIYEMITACGGTEKFYAQFFIGSVCPLGLVKNGKNINYYDDKELLKITEPFIIKNLERLFDFNVERKICFIIGGEKNFNYFSTINNRFCWFEEVIPLPHPRFIMQYKRKQKHQFIQQYVQFLSK